MQHKVFIPAEYLERVMEVSQGVFNQDEELYFLKACMYYLKEGMNADQAIDMAMIDYLVDL
ncbi:hypothetical protein GVN16_02080 [Emticicia sp. CRIBPO]|jgi:hypothetical protein|uniref:hypothetical protein n=1 Tax=Emticicia sp. CRIBPO TaxID=2683258 RepID=UPI001411F652|nr:hypothetical protein [Emticicia sp. CRIBPO]NBA84528.1 hypothetical protein [Emticicia sp. CRIBPO]